MREHQIISSYETDRNFDFHDRLQKALDEGWEVTQLQITDEYFFAIVSRGKQLEEGQMVEFEKKLNQLLSQAELDFRRHESMVNSAVFKTLRQVWEDWCSQ